MSGSIELILKSLERFGARAVVLASDAHVLLRFDGGDRYATQSTPHQALVDMVGGLATSAAREAIDDGEVGEFEHFYDGSIYRILVVPEGGRWTVTISPAGVEVPATPPSAPQPTAPERRIKRTTASNRWIDQLLVKMVDAGASDLHLSSSSPPHVRLHGQIRAEGTEPVERDFLLGKLFEIMPEVNRAEFEERSDTDFAYALEGVARFRVNMFADRNGPGAVLRQIPHDVPDADKLGIPAHVLELCDLNKGLVLVTGPTGSGKSTTLAALIDHINKTRAAHIITIEDPIEFVHANKRCLINQREVHTHTRSFKDALRAALREDPDIVLVGEMRDLETIHIAVETAETGHLVFGTLHTSTAPSTVDRIIDQFPADRQEQIRQMVAKSLRGVIAQTLCRRKAGGRVAAYEILIATPAVENLIRERKSFQLYSVIQTSRNLGMRTLGDSLVELARQGVIDGREAYLKAVNKEEIKNLLGRANITI
jgi:twitching motility protein PilT